MSPKLPPSAESRLTARYQTTVPAFVRQSLGLTKGDRIRYSLTPDNQVVLSRVSPAEADPMIENFLNFLSQDMVKNPQHIQAIDTHWVDQIHALVRKIEVDLDTPLLDEDE